MLRLMNSILLSVFIGTYLLHAFSDDLFVRLLMAVVALIFCCINFNSLKPLTRNMVILLLMISGVCVWASPVSLDWTLAITENAGIVTMLLTAPLLGSILRFAAYETALLAFAARYIHTSYQFYMLTICLVSFLGILMNLAAVPFVYQLMSPLLKKYPAEILHKALYRGYAVNLFWAPNMICVAVVLQYVNIPWELLAPIGLVFSGVSFVISSLIEKFAHPQGRSNEMFEPIMPAQNGGQTEKTDAKRYLLMLLVQLTLIIVVITGLTGHYGKNIYVSLAMTALVMPLFFAVLMGKLNILGQSVSYFWQQTLPGMSNEFTQFICIGFFGYAFAHSPAIQFVQEQLSIFGSYNSGIVGLLIIALITGLALVGIHPIISISSIAISFSTQDSVLAGLPLAIALLAGYTMYFFLSPFSSMVMIMAGLSKKNVYEIGLRLNWQYTIVLTLIIAIMLHMWRVA